MAKVSVGVQVTFQVQMFQQCVVSTAQKLIENVEISLVGVLVNDARLLQQIVQDVSSVRNSLPLIKRPLSQSYLKKLFKALTN